MQKGVSGTFGMAERHPRIMTAGNLVVNVLAGGSIGLTSAALVLWLSASMLPPWNYLLTAGILLFAKVVWRWITTLFLGPMVGKWAAMMFESRTGAVVPKHLQNFKWGNESLSIVTFAATMAVAGYLSNLAAEPQSPAMQMGNNGILGITAAAGLVTAAAQNLSSRISIISLWHNRFEYQENPLYVATEPHAQQQTSGNRTSNTMTSSRRPDFGRRRRNRK
ncbi:MAG: hypothetical protein OXE87_06965 [Chloroflexi bacterium]|nr:hypothetical protein [Chloroflexota bacterium]